MARFLGHVIVEQVDAFWVLRSALTYVDSALVPDPVTIPELLVTDFASIPRALWAWAPPTEHTHAAASLLHDFVYECHRHDRRTADALFCEAMRATGTRRTKAWLMWSAVRAFGGPAYRTGPARQAERLAAYRRLIEVADTVA